MRAGGLSGARGAPQTAKMETVMPGRTPKLPAGPATVTTAIISCATTLDWFKPFDVAKHPSRAWLYGKHYQRQTVSLTAGPGGMGKSSLDLVEGVSMATCRNLLGEQPEERLRLVP